MENAKKKDYTRQLMIWILVPLCTVIFVFMLIFAFRDELNRTKNESRETMTYTVHEYEGQIGIFREGNSFPYKVLNVYIFTLPDTDEERLREGFSVVGENGVRAVIEDFTG